MRLVGKVLRSRVAWCIIGILIGLYLIPNIPAGSIGDILKFLWAQKWGILIGAAIIVVVRLLKKGVGGYRIVKEEESSERR